MTNKIQLLQTLLLAAPLALATACGDDGSTDDGSSPTTTSGPDDSTGPAATDTTTGDSEPGTDGSTGPASGGSTTDPGDDTTTDGDSSGSEGSSGSEDGLEIIGEWREEFAPGMGIDHVILEDRWDQLADFGDAIFHIEGYDNDARWVIAVGDPANEFGADLYSKFNWSWDGTDLYYCTAAFDAATFEDAMATPNADDGDLASGCGGFPWSLLMPQM